MADLQARIGPKATKLYSNLSWKRPGADLQSPSKNTARRNQSDEKDDSYASSHKHASSSPTHSSPRYRGRSLPRPRDSSAQPSLLIRMGLSSGPSEDGASDGKEAAGIQQLLLPRVGTAEDTPRSSPNIGSTRDGMHVPDSNGYHGTANSKLASPPSLPSSSNGQRNAIVPGKQAPDDRHNRSVHVNSNGDQTKFNNGYVVKPLTTEPTLLKSPPQEQDFEDGELFDSEPIASHIVRAFTLPLLLENAARRVKEGGNDLSRATAQRVLSDEVCSSFMDQMKEVRTEMHAHKNRSSTNPPQMQLSGEIKNSEAAPTPPLSKIGQAPPSGPRAMYPDSPNVSKSKYKPPNGEIVTKSNASKDQPIPALSSHSHDPSSPSNSRRREPEVRRTPIPEPRGHDQDRRYSQHREKWDGPRSPSHSPRRYSPGRSNHHIARSRSPVTPPGRRRSPPLGSSPSIRDRAFHARRESPEEIRGRRSISPPGVNNYNRMPDRRRSFSRDVSRTERPWNQSPRRDPPRSPVSRRRFRRRRADKAMSPYQSSFTRDRSVEHESSRRPWDSYVSTGSEFARRSASPHRKQNREFSVERPLPRTPLRRSPRPATPRRSSFEPERRRDRGEDHMESVSPGTRSTTHLASRATLSHPPTPKPMVIENKDIHEKVEEVRMPKASNDMTTPEPGVLPCHNVPGVWFVKVALGDIGTLDCSFEVDNITALNWNLRPANVNLPNTKDVPQKERLQLHVCCLLQQDVQSVMGSLKPDATAQDVASAMLAIDNNWPTPGHLIIIINPQDQNNKRIWLPDKLGSPCLPVHIEDSVVEGQNIVQFIQLSGMSEKMFVLFATTKPLSDELQHDDDDDDDDGVVLAQKKVDEGKEDIIFGQVTISDIK